jgi:hypothetical protein
MIKEYTTSADRASASYEFLGKQSGLGLFDLVGGVDDSGSLFAKALA